MNKQFASKPENMPQQRDNNISSISNNNNNNNDAINLIAVATNFS